MGEWSSYSLSDFILFSADTYYRQFELYNQAVWPLHVVAVVFSLLIFYALWKRPAWAGRVISALLVVSWLWVAWAFLYERFYPIHVVADWYALGFVLQAGLIMRQGVIKNGLAELTNSSNRLSWGAGLLFIALVIYPFIAFVVGRYWKTFEMFALTPDPTVLATLAILLLYKSPTVLYVIPFLWVVISAVTLSIM